MKGLIIVPAYNEEEVVESVIKQLPNEVLGRQINYLVINDGSTDHTEEVLHKIKANFVSHPINRGLGAALGTGLEYAKDNNYDFAVTLDADGQHDPKEIGLIVKPIIEDKADFVIGTRVFKKGMPLTRKILTFFASLATYTFTGVWTTDSQSGFRAFSKKAIQAIRIDVDRMEVSTEFFNQSRKNRLRYKEIEITPIYTDYSLKKGQNMLNSFNILGKLVFKKLMH